MKNKKLVSSVIAVALAAGILLGGTFAWQSISQQALNEIYGFVNPGGRLHDDFTVLPDLTTEGTKQYDKNVYVENFTSMAEDGVQVFARIRLDEYMEIGPKAGRMNPEGTDKAVDNEAVSLDYDAKLWDKTTWKTHIPNDTTDPFHEYWKWTMGGEDGDGTAVYMPTFNKNKDSLQADVNGTFAGKDGVPFGDYVAYAAGDTSDVYDVSTGTNKKLLAIYDADKAAAGTSEVDELARDGVNVQGVITGATNVDAYVGAGHITLEEETHTAKTTLGAYVIPMATYMEWLNNDNPLDDSGNFWVWDIDGWAYWAAPIDPDTATGLFLDGISRTKTIINEDWYYGINVVAQFVTADDLGRPAPGETGTGFYAENAGAEPTTNALKLLAAIGVDVDTTVTASADPAADGAALTSALELGGNVTISGTVNSDTEVTPWTSAPQYTAEYVMANGGTLNGGAVTLDGDKVMGFVVEAGADSARTTALNDVVMNGDSEAVLYVGENGGHVTLNGVQVTADGGAGIYAEWAQGGVTLNNCTVNQQNLNPAHDAWFETAVAAAQGAEITINGGIYNSSKYAVYVFTSGGTVTINDGTFTGELKADNTDWIVIKGGSFDHDPTAFVADGYKAEFDSGLSRWVVTTA
ncbi:MAG: hypothetical protein IJA33_02830 [Oscillospiraceae bacterium]|nr:hypothetical protein [Oscillospiraceae bacterium]